MATCATCIWFDGVAYDNGIIYGICRNVNGTSAVVSTSTDQCKEYKKWAK